VYSSSLEDIMSVGSNDQKTLDFASRGYGLSIYTVADQIEFLQASGSDAPVRPGIYQWAGKSKAIAIVDLELNTAVNYHNLRMAACSKLDSRGDVLETHNSISCRKGIR